MSTKTEIVVGRASYRKVFSAIFRAVEFFNSHAILRQSPKRAIISHLAMEYARWMNEHPIGTILAGQEACQARVWTHSVGIINTIRDVDKILAPIRKQMVLRASAAGVLTTSS